MAIKPDELIKNESRTLYYYRYGISFLSMSCCNGFLNLKVSPYIPLFNSLSTETLFYLSMNPSPLIFKLGMSHCIGFSVIIPKCFYV